MAGPGQWLQIVGAFLPYLAPSSLRAVGWNEAEDTHTESWCDRAWKSPHISDSADVLMASSAAPCAPHPPRKQKKEWNQRLT